MYCISGDELYPSAPDYEGTKELVQFDETVKSLCLRAKRLNRGVRGGWAYYVNVVMPCGHLPHQFAYKTFPQNYDIKKITSKLWSLILFAMLYDYAAEMSLFVMLYGYAAERSLFAMLYGYAAERSLFAMLYGYATKDFLCYTIKQVKWSFCNLVMS